MLESFTSSSPPSKTELDFVDEDIAEYFRSRWKRESQWPFGMPTQMQLARYMKRLCALIESQTLELQQRHREPKDTLA